jgi:uncharacterized membrane protein YeaQ/YmgE (transglycosylase-associated protein family)
MRLSGSFSLEIVIATERISRQGGVGYVAGYSVFAVVGVAAGWLAGVVTRTDRSIWGDLLLGLAGALVVGLVTNGLVGGDSGLIVAIVASAVVAIILVLIKNNLFGGRRVA